jgi:hypothetical protein
MRLLIIVLRSIGAGLGGCVLLAGFISMAKAGIPAIKNSKFSLFWSSFTATYNSNLDQLILWLLLPLTVVFIYFTLKAERPAQKEQHSQKFVQGLFAVGAIMFGIYSLAYISGAATFVVELVIGLF